MNWSLQQTQNLLNINYSLCKRHKKVSKNVFLKSMMKMVHLYPLTVHTVSQLTKENSTCSYMYFRISTSPFFYRRNFYMAFLAVMFLIWDCSYVNIHCSISYLRISTCPFLAARCKQVVLPSTISTGVSNNKEAHRLLLSNKSTIWNIKELLKINLNLYTGIYIYMSCVGYKPTLCKCMYTGLSNKL